MNDQRKINAKARGFQVNTKQRRTNEQREGKECEMRGHKLRTWEYENHKVEKDYEIGLEDSWSC